VPDHASWGRRISAFLIDGAASTLVTILLIGMEQYVDPTGPGRWWVLGVFYAEVALLTALVGGSFGQVVVGIRVLRTHGHPLTLLRSMLRTALILLVVPPLVFESGSGRGLHDIWTDAGAYRKPGVTA
jgi:uncharacterized RDD family membrane protein YckC